MRTLLCFSVCLLSALCLRAQRSPEVVPGLHVPDGRRPWALDEFQGKQELVPVHSTAVQANNHKGSNLAGGLLAGPFYKSKFTTEIDGPSAHTALHKMVPAFYLYMDPDPDAGQTQFAGWVIVHAAVDKDRRLLSTVKFTQFTGNAKRNATQVEIKTESLPGGWLRLIPTEPLAPGEYALVPVMKQENAYSLVVYDFKIDPSAENASDAVKP